MFANKKNNRFHAKAGMKFTAHIAFPVTGENVIGNKVTGDMRVCKAIKIGPIYGR
ncbi:hypothetical protein TDB9533_03843 [Thalassocella blandensis]|nr:hypothetical protein TDB9533_03843 [Thalassocella blandensis]